MAINLIGSNPAADPVAGFYDKRCDPRRREHLGAAQPGRTRSHHDDPLTIHDLTIWLDDDARAAVSVAGSTLDRAEGMP